MKVIPTLLALVSSVHSITAITADYQPATDLRIAKQQSHEDMLLSLYKPVNLQNGIKDFLKNTYNNPAYAREVLPNNFSHMTQFLAHGKRMGQKRSYVQSVLRLFNNKLKGSSYVNAYALLDMLEQLPSLTSSYFFAQGENTLDTLKDNVNTLLYDQFLHNFQDFRTDPDAFLLGLSTDIATSVNRGAVAINDISIEELRKTLLIFVETALGKLVWSPEDKDQTWSLVKQLSAALTSLTEHNIISDTDDLHDVFVTLLERYHLFLDIAGEQMPIEFFDKIKTDIASNQHLVLELEETEELIDSKLDRFKCALFESETKARATNHGFMIS